MSEYPFWNCNCDLGYVHCIAMERCEKCGETREDAKRSDEAEVGIMCNAFGVGYDNCVAEAAVGELTPWDALVLGSHVPNKKLARWIGIRYDEALPLDYAGRKELSKWLADTFGVYLYEDDLPGSLSELVCAIAPVGEEDMVATAVCKHLGLAKGLEGYAQEQMLQRCAEAVFRGMLRGLEQQAARMDRQYGDSNRTYRKALACAVAWFSKLEAVGDW